MSINNFLKVTCVIAVILFGACTGSKLQNGAPKDVLTEYVSRSFAVKSLADKVKLVELTTGEVKKVLEEMKDESFQQYFVAQKKEFISLKVKDERSLSDNTYSITYELTFKQQSLAFDGQLSQDLITNKKHAVFVKNDGHWIISEVKNLKTDIEHQNEMSF